MSPSKRWRAARAEGGGLNPATLEWAALCEHLAKLPNPGRYRNGDTVMVDGVTYRMAGRSLYQSSDHPEWMEV